MSIRRKTATPIYQKPLTSAELEGKAVTKSSKGSPITCQECKASGGTLVKMPDTLPQTYRHQDKEKCGMMKLRR